MKKNTLAELSLFLVAIFWGGGFVAVKDALNTIEPFYLVGLRFIIPAVILALLFYPRVRKAGKNEIMSGALIGLFLFAGFAAQTIGLQYTQPGKQAFITAIYIIIVPFLYWLLMKVPPDKFTLSSVVLTLIGIGMITLKDSFHLNTGDIWTLAADVFFAMHIVAVGYFSQKYDTILLTIIQMFTAGLLALMIAIFIEPVPQLLNGSGWLSMAYLIIFSTTLAYLIQNVAQKYTAPTNAAIIMSLESVFGAIFSILLLGEVFTISKVIGCFIIFCAIIICETKLSFLFKKQSIAVSAEN